LNFLLNTEAKLKPATCQNHALVNKNPTPSASSPKKDKKSALKAIAQAFQ